MDIPFKLTMYDRAFNRMGWLGDPLACEFTPRHNAIGSMSVTVQSGHPKLEFLIAEGARLVVDYNGQRLMSGELGPWSMSGGMTDGAVTLTYQDDMAIWWETLGWPNPTQLISAQNTGGVKEDKLTGPAETVAKTFMSRNGVTRLGNPITVAATNGWGSTVTVAFRMVPLADNLMTVVDQAGVGLSVTQTGSTLVVDAYQPRTYPHTLTEQSGIIIPGTVSFTPPTATRTVVAGPGVGTSREWLQRVDTAREALWRRKETLTDASDTEVTTEREQRGDDALIAAGPKSGFSIGLSETAAFRYGTNLRVGDTVTIDLGGGVTVTDILREATLSWTRDNGLVVTPTIGERTDDGTTKLAQILASVVKRVRMLTTNDGP